MGAVYMMSYRLGPLASKRIPKLPCAFGTIVSDPRIVAVSSYGWSNILNSPDLPSVTPSFVKKKVVALLRSDRHPGRFAKKERRINTKKLISKI
jgi:hypothetical protein